jgi:hypothetical protein
MAWSSRFETERCYRDFDYQENQPYDMDGTHGHALFIWIMMVKIKDGPASNLVQDDHGCLQLQLQQINFEPYYMQNVPRPRHPYTNVA